jgi:protein-tyrosine phosphatase
MLLLHWFPVGGGALALGPRPGKRTYPALRDATDVLTLLTAEEGALAIQAEIERLGLRFWHLPLPNGKPFPPERDAAIRECFVPLRARLGEGARLYVHCAAGIHRTGMIGGALLYFLGLGDAEVRAALAALRSHTAEGVGEERLAVARRFAQSDS